MPKNGLTMTCALSLSLLSGCARYRFDAPPDAAAKAAQAVAETLKIPSKRSDDSNSIRITLGVAPFREIGMLRLTASDSGTGTRYFGEFHQNDFMPKGMLRGFFAECLYQQLQLDSGTRSPHKNRQKSFYKYQALNILSPSISAYYAVKGNPFYAPYAKYPAIATQGIMEFGAIMTAIGYFDADTGSQREKSLNAFLFYFGVSRGIGMLLGWNLKYYEQVQAVPYDLSAMSFSF